MLAITVTYVPYILAELPSNLIIKKVGPRILLPCLCTSWGVVTTLQSQLKSYGGLIACRFFLGLLEGGLFPGIVLYLSSFYRRHELQMRIGLFFSAAAMSGAFSGLLAAAIVQMNGIGGLTGWQWIFLLEGLFTVCFGVMTGFLLPDTPQQVFSFTKAEADHCVERLKADVFAEETPRINIKALLSTFTDLHIWLLCIALFCNGTSLFGLAYFTPSIVQGLGYSGTKTQLLTVPPFAIALVVTMISAFVADRYRSRGLTAICNTCLAVAGFAMFLGGSGTATRYAALCLMISGVYSAAPCLVSWVPNNSAGHTRRATAVALGFISTNVGGIISTWIYPRSAAPDYQFAARYNLSLSCITIAVTAGEIWLLSRMNQTKSEQSDLILRDVQHLPVQQQIDSLGDHHPSFRYTL